MPRSQARGQVWRRGLHHCLSVCVFCFRLKREGFEEAGELVVRHVIEQTDGGLVGFERLWRQHFVDTMKPSFLPTGWSVEHSRDQLLCLEHDVLRYVAQERGPDRCN